MELCASAAQSLSRCSFSVTSLARCSTSYGSSPACYVIPRHSLSCGPLFIAQRRVNCFFVREANAGRCYAGITVGVPDAEFEEYTENKEGRGKNGFQLLGNKEKKELRAYAHSLGKDLNVQQVGKLGITPNVITSISDALEANEIVKVKVLENCESEQDEIITQLEDGTGAQTVGRIGRTLLLYRASLKKLAAAEDKKKSEKPKRRSRLAMSAGRSTVKNRRGMQ